LQNGPFVAPPCDDAKVCIQVVAQDLEEYRGKGIASLAHDKPIKVLNPLLREEVGSRVPSVQYQTHDTRHGPFC
ncbi:MAG: hypothetical protein AAB299_08175, partial [Thermodesulfobacteriota bacterium]